MSNETRPFEDVDRALKQRCAEDNYIGTLRVTVWGSNRFVRHSVRHFDNETMKKLHNDTSLHSDSEDEHPIQFYVADVKFANRTMQLMLQYTAVTGDTVPTCRPRESPEVMPVCLQNLRPCAL